MKIEPKKETKTLTKLAKIALSGLQRDTNTALMAILEADAEAQGFDPKDGWSFNQQSSEWTRGVTQ
jgi:hypothetical protein